MRPILVLMVLLSCMPVAAMAAPFEEAWSEEGRLFETGEFDGLAGLELMMSFTTSGRFELRDPVTGTLEYQFPIGYSPNLYQTLVGNLDGDASDELVLYTSLGDPMTGRLGLFDVLGPAPVESGNPPPPSFGPRWEIPNYGTCGGIQAGDFEGDGTLEVLAVVPNGFRIHDHSTGATLFDWNLEMPPSLAAEEATVVDLDLDGRDEVLVRSRDFVSGVRSLHVIRSTAPLGVAEPRPGFESRQLAAHNAPNPFAGPTRIDFDLPARARVTVAVYDAAGRRVRSLLDETRAPGRHQVTWDGRDDGGRGLRSGVFFYEVEAGGERIARKMLRLR